jgi:hypothetical protein
MTRTVLALLAWLIVAFQAYTIDQQKKELAEVLNLCREFHRKIQTTYDDRD